MQYCFRWCAAGVLSYLCSDGVEAWDIVDPSRETVMEAIVKSIGQWEFWKAELADMMSFKALNCLLLLQDCNAAVHCATWTLANFTNSRRFVGYN